jgi:hypothetical protein
MLSGIGHLKDYFFLSQKTMNRKMTHEKNQGSNVQQNCMVQIEITFIKISWNCPNVIAREQLRCTGRSSSRVSPVAVMTKTPSSAAARSVARLDYNYCISSILTIFYEVIHTNFVERD